MVDELSLDRCWTLQTSAIRTLLPSSDTMPMQTSGYHITRLSDVLIACTNKPTWLVSADKDMRQPHKRPLPVIEDIF